MVLKSPSGASASTMRNAKPNLNDSQRWNHAFGVEQINEVEAG